MAIEDVLIKVGAFLSTADYRDSTLSGTTHTGPNGSAQFQAVRLSSGANLDLIIGLCTAAGQAAIGVLQNKPNANAAADVAIFGVTKAVAGSTFGAGIDLEVDSSGCMTAYSSAAGVAKIGKSLETVTGTGQVFAMLLYGMGNGGGSIA